jgi:hypothetical protein
MNIRSAVAQIANPIGEDIAGHDHLTQASLLNGFFEMFQHLMPDANQREMQIAYVTREMSPKAKKMLIRFAEFCQEDE